MGQGTHDRQVIRTVCRSKKRQSNMQEKRRESLGSTRYILWFHRIKTENTTKEHLWKENNKYLLKNLKMLS